MYVNFQIQGLLGLPQCKEILFRIRYKNQFLAGQKTTHSLILKVKESRKLNFLFNQNLQATRACLAKSCLFFFFYYCVQHKINALNMARPNINAVMECHDISTQYSENDLHYPAKHLNSFSSTPVPGCFSSRKFNAKVWLSSTLLIQLYNKTESIQGHVPNHLSVSTECTCYKGLKENSGTQSQCVLFDAWQSQPQESASLWEMPFCLFVFISIPSVQ